MFVLKYYWVFLGGAYRRSLKASWSPLVYRHGKDHFSPRVFQGTRSGLPPIEAESLLALKAFCSRNHQHPSSLLSICVALTACQLPLEPRALCPDAQQSMQLPSSFGPPTSGLPSSGFLVILSPPSKRTDFHFLCQPLSGNNLRPEKYRARADKFLFRLRSLLLHRAHSHVICEPPPPTLTFGCEGDQRMGFTKVCVYFSKCMALWSR